MKKRLGNKTKPNGKFTHERKEENEGKSSSVRAYGPVLCCAVQDLYCTVLYSMFAGGESGGHDIPHTMSFTREYPHMADGDEESIG